MLRALPSLASPQHHPNGQLVSLTKKFLFRDDGLTRHQDIWNTRVDDRRTCNQNVKGLMKTIVGLGNMFVKCKKAFNSKGLKAKLE